MNRLLVAILLLTALLPAITPSQTIGADPVLLQDFDRNACYSKCPCAFAGAEQASVLTADRNVMTSTGRILTRN